MKYIVYKTINKVNSKEYIGVHKTDNPDKWDYYLGCGVKATMPSTYEDPHTQFQAAVLKYGPENFVRNILYVYDTAKEAYLKERELVNEEYIKLDTNYNMVLGGGGLRPSNPIYQFTTSGKLVRKWETLEEAQGYYNCTLNTFKTALHFKEKLFGFFWSRKTYIDVSRYSKGTNKKPCYKYNKLGKLLEIYNSLSECCKIESTTIGHLTAAIQGHVCVSKKYYYSDTLYETFIPKKKIKLKDKHFYLYTLEGTFIRECTTLQGLMNFMGVKDRSSVSDVINRRNGLYKIYQISVEYKEKLEPIVNKNTAKPIDVFTKKGEYIETCESIYKVILKYLVHSSSLNRVLRGLAKSTGGYSFKYHN